MRGWQLFKRINKFQGYKQITQGQSSNLPKLSQLACGLRVPHLRQKSASGRKALPQFVQFDGTCKDKQHSTAATVSSKLTLHGLIPFVTAVPAKVGVRHVDIATVTAGATLRSELMRTSMPLQEKQVCRPWAEHCCTGCDHRRRHICLRRSKQILRHQEPWDF